SESRVRSQEAQGRWVGSPKTAARGRRTVVRPRMESTRPTAPLVDRRGCRRVSVVVRRQSGGPPRLLSATERLPRGTENGRGNGGRAARIIAGERARAGAELSGRPESWVGPDPRRDAEARFPARHPAADSTNHRSSRTHLAGPVVRLRRVPRV